MKTKILIADDHSIFRTGLTLLIEGNPGFVIVGECGELGNLDEKIAETNPEIVLLDLNFLDGNGLDRIPDLVKKVKVIVLTAETEQEVHKSCLKAGAHGLVVKTQAAEQVVEAITRVSNGEMWFDQGLMAAVVQELTRPIDEPVLAEVEKIKSLSPREREVIELVGEGLKNVAIADRLFISDTTVRHHMTSIFSKLDLTSRLELVIFAFRHGLAKAPERAIHYGR
jgi:DNA-binding NarL/FixJ family response regulator